MGRLTTLVLDTAHGVPAAGVAFTLHRDLGGRFLLVRDGLTNAEGRVDAPLLEGAALVPGRYRLVFRAGDYFRARNVALSEPPFVDEVTIDFGIADAQAHYHLSLIHI